MQTGRLDNEFNYSGRHNYKPGAFALLQNTMHQEPGLTPALQPAQAPIFKPAHEPAAGMADEPEVFMAADALSDLGFSFMAAFSSSPKPAAPQLQPGRMPPRPSPRSQYQRNWAGMVGMSGPAFA